MQNLFNEYCPNTAHFIQGSFIDAGFANRLKLNIYPAHTSSKITMASVDHEMSLSGNCKTYIQYGEHEKFETTLGVIDSLCADVIIGHDI